MMSRSEEGRRRHVVTEEEEHGLSQLGALLLSAHQPSSLHLAPLGPPVGSQDLQERP
jgi:hypothetical protein